MGNTEDCLIHSAKPLLIMLKMVYCFENQTTKWSPITAQLKDIKYLFF